MGRLLIILGMLLMFSSCAYPPNRTLIGRAYAQQEYQKVKYTVVIRGSVYGEYTMSDWIADKDVPAFFEFVGIDQKKVEEGLDAWETAEQYAKDHPAPVQEPKPIDFLNLYNERMSEAQTYLDKYILTANATELSLIKTNLDNKVSALKQKFQRKKLNDR